MIVFDSMDKAWIPAKSIAEVTCSSGYSSLENTVASCNYFCNNQCVQFAAGPVLNASIAYSQQHCSVSVCSYPEFEYDGVCPGPKVFCEDAP